MAERIRASFIPDVVLGVLRGGAIAAVILSDLLDVHEVNTIGVKHYVDIARKAVAPRLTLSFSVSLDNRKVLIVDDVVDTGETLNLVSKRVKELKASDSKTSAIYCKPWAYPKPDFYYEERSEWIVFPWEVKETVTSVAKRFRSEGRNLKEVKETLIKSGIEENLIEEILCMVAV